ncbi:MAG TPA: right-handed parallel beta-helix repeat-containing protein, partial [Gemmataceae bacterium]|nr:right-handed parallel beta-helix repeat-containing protein [Gemmataceae bacterium]
MRWADLWRLLGPLLLSSPPALAGDSTVHGDYFVATNGSDHNPGTQDKPFATIGRARDEVRKKIGAGLQADVCVLIRGGTYQLQEPFVIGPQDSGTDKHAITYTAFPGEKPLFSGGRKITGWRQVEGRLWTAEIQSVKEGKWYFRQLFVGGQRRQRARIPNQGFFQVIGNIEVKGETSSFHFRKGDIHKSWAEQGDVECVVLQKWADARLPLKSVDEGALTAIVSGKPSPYSAFPDSPYWVENAMGGLDRPGTWYLNRKTGVLYYWPLPGEDMNKVEVIAPLLEELVRLSGAMDGRSFVRNIRLRGLTFSYSDWSLPPTGYANVQAASQIPGAYQASYAISCSVEDCAFEHLGKYALEIGPGSKNHRVTGNRLADLGAGGIKIGVGGSGHVIANNYIHDAGLVYPGCVGIWVSIAAGTTVAHNLLHDLPYTGISVGWSWNADPTSARNNRIEYNHVHHVMKLMGDGAGIYTLGLQPGTVLRGNLIHDVQRSPNAQGSANHGLYLDEGSKGFRVEGNIVYHIAGEPLFFHQSQEDWHTWGANSFGIEPGSTTFPKEAAAMIRSSMMLSCPPASATVPSRA